MTPFQLWAPYAKTVEVEVSGGRHPMARVGDGWWFTELSLPEAAADYGFVLDGEVGEYHGLIYQPLVLAVPAAVAAPLGPH